MATDFNLASIGAPVITLPNIPTVMPASGTATTGLEITYSAGLAQINVGCVLSNPGTLSLQRYIDTVGVIPQGGPVTASLLANTPGSVTVGDGSAFASFNVTISAVAGTTVSNFACIGRSMEASGGSSLPFAQDLRLAELRYISYLLAQLVNSAELPALLRKDFLSEMGSSATSGIGSL